MITKKKKKAMNRQIYRARIEFLTNVANTILAQRTASSINKFIRSYSRGYLTEGILFNDKRLYDIHKQEMLYILSRAYKKIIPVVSRFVFSNIELTLNKTDQPQVINTFTRVAIQFIEEFGLDKAQTIADTSRKQVRNILANSLMQGLGQEEVSAQIRGVQAMTGARALTIARTETFSALSFSSQETAYNIREDFSLELVKEWVSANDEATRLDHSEANGQRRKLEEPYLIGDELMDMPRDPKASAGNVINCRCVELYERA